MSDLAISKMQNITPIMKSPYKLMIFLLCLVLLKNDIGLFTSDSKGFTMTSINNKEHIIAFANYIRWKLRNTCIFKCYPLIMYVSEEEVCLYHDILFLSQNCVILNLLSFCDQGHKFLKISKSQKQFFLKLHCPRNEQNIWQNSALTS